jgi:hypothetical protein
MFFFFFFPMCAIHSVTFPKYYCLANYEAAAADGDKAIEYAPQWAKGYARKGNTNIMYLHIKLTPI